MWLSHQRSHTGIVLYKCTPVGPLPGEGDVEKWGGDGQNQGGVDGLLREGDRPNACQGEALGMADVHGGLPPVVDDISWCA